MPLLLVSRQTNLFEQLSFEERAKLAAWLHGSPQRVRPMADWKDDEMGCADETRCR
jgi:hypothetical protein